MAVYTVSIAGATLSTSNDTRTLVTTATGAGSVIRLEEFFVGGEASASAVNRIAFNRPGTAGITGGSAQTPEKLDPASGAATFTVPTTWSTQPVASTNHVVCVVFNAFGGVIRWVAQPDRPVVVGGQGAVANLIAPRSLSGTSVVSGYLQVEER